jgi:hypothetical protein
VSTVFAEAAAHPSLLDRVCHQINKTNYGTFLASNNRFRNVVLTQLDLDTNRSVKRLWKRIGPDVVDLTLVEYNLRASSLCRMLREAKNLKALKVSDIHHATLCKWRANEFKGLATNIRKLNWNIPNSFRNKGNALLAILKVMPEITEISLGIYESFQFVMELSSNVKEILQKRLTVFKRFEIVALDVEDVLTFGSPALLPNMKVVRLQTTGSSPNEFLARLVNLESLSMINVPLDDTTFAIVAGLNKLESLELSGYELSVDWLKNISKLQSLKVNCPKISVVIIF